MDRLSALFVSLGLFTTTLLAQTSDIIVFSDMGEKFTLVIDGEEKNAAPASRVVATGIKNTTPLLVVRFADANVPPVKQNAWMEPGHEYTLLLTTNKKGQHVLRMQGETAQSTTTTTEPKPAPTNFQDDPQPGTEPDGTADTPSETPASTDGTTHTTTTTTTVETTGTPDGDNVNINLGINGMGVNVNMNGGAIDQQGTKTTTTTTTHTTTTTNGHPTQPASFAPPTKPRPAAAAAAPDPGYRMPGYTGPIGCTSAPMTDTEFNDVKQSISSKGFEETKLAVAKQIGRDHCFTTAQVKGIMQLFGFEDSKLDFAKFAYDHTYDIGNYYKVNDVFGFESSVDELDQYIRSR